MTTAPIVMARTTEAEVDRSILKIVLIALAGAGLSLLSVKLFLNFAFNIRPEFLFLWLASAIAFLVVILLETLFVKSSAKLFGIMFVQAIIPLGLFWESVYPSVSIPLLIGFILFLFFLAFGSHKGWRFLSESTAIRFSFMSKIVLPKAILGMMIFLMSVLYVQYFEKGKFTDELGESVVSEILIASEPIVNVWFPGTSFNQNAKSFFEAVAESQLKNAKVETTRADGARVLVDFSILTDDMKREVVEGAGNTIRGVFEEKMNFSFSPSDPISKSIFLSVKNFFRMNYEKLGNAFAVLVLAVIFFAIKGIFSLIHWFISFLAFVVYKFLIAIGFAYVNIETKSREFVLLS